MAVGPKLHPKTANLRAPSLRLRSTSFASSFTSLPRLVFFSGGSKRKRHEEESNPKGAENGVTTKNGVAAPTHVICSREAFAAGKVSKDMDQILSKYPLSKGGGSVKVRPKSVNKSMLSAYPRQSLNRTGCKEARFVVLVIGGRRTLA